MSINMADVKQIINNANNKEVVKIQDSLGNILWQKQASITYPYLFMSNKDTAQSSKNINVEWTWTNGSSPGPVSLAEGQYYWSDGTTLYYSGLAIGNQYVYTGSIDNYDSTAWTQKTDSTWNGLKGSGMIKINGDIYCLNGSSTKKYNPTLDRWEPFTISGSTYAVTGDTVWTDGTDIYWCTSNTKIRVLDQTNMVWGNEITVASTTRDSYMYWTDGTNVYYSNGSNQKVWDKANRNWVNKTWTGLTNFGGNEVFFYNDEIYVRNGASPYAIYKLDKATSTWTQAYTNPMGNSNFRGARMWDLGGRSTANTAVWLTGLRRANK